jgi:8-oxo-dGTP pyrophosphatase MutT (NUDIX family)
MSSDFTEAEIIKLLETACHPNWQHAADDKINSVNRALTSELKCAAVLLPLFHNEMGWHLVFTRRTDTVEDHKGQVSFPGGGCNDHETIPEQTALREAEEEIGLLPQDVRILGKLNEVKTISHFRVTPVVGVIRWPYPFHLSHDEVSRVFSIPLDWMAEPAHWDEFDFTPEGSLTSFPVVTYHVYDGEILWGASARITQNFLGALNLIKHSSSADNLNIV